MIVTVIRCDRCKQLVDSPPPDGGATAGYYSGWEDSMNPGEPYHCDGCYADLFPECRASKRA